MSLKTDMTGQEFITNQGSRIKVIKYINNKKVLIEFQDKYRHQMWVQKDKILKGKVKNPFHPSVCGVGFHGFIENASRHPLYFKWASMLDRCYNPESSSYKDYGAKGIYVSEDWHNFANYVKDVSLMENFHAMLENPTEWHLDKDKSGSSLYSKSTCSIISRQENNELRKGDKAMREVYQYTLSGRHISTFKSEAEAGRAMNKGNNGKNLIGRCCRGEIPTAYGFIWTFGEVK